MKKTIFALAIATTFFAGTATTGCQSSDSKSGKEHDKVNMDMEHMDMEHKNSMTEVEKNNSADEWKAFRKDAEARIRDNETRIAEAREKMKETGKVIDAVLEKKIDLLEKRNKDLRAKLDAYERDQSDWESFKREFNRDMDAIGQAFRDLTVDNKK